MSRFNDWSGGNVKSSRPVYFALGEVVHVHDQPVDYIVIGCESPSFVVQKFEDWKCSEEFTFGGIDCTGDPKAVTTMVDASNMKGCDCKL